MNAVYFNTHFHRKRSEDWGNRPAAFAVITAYPTTGEVWPQPQIDAADRALQAELRERSSWVRRLTGFDPSTNWAEPGWAVEIDFQSACDIGYRFKQDAIYYVMQDRLYVSYCDHRRCLVEVGEFDERLHEVE